MAETLKVDREPPWKFPLEHRSASSSPLASSITLSCHGDGGLEDREEDDGPGRTTPSDRPRLITEVDAKPPSSPPPSFRREEETSSPSKRLKFDDPSAVHRREQPDERKPARVESKERRSSGKPRGGSSADGAPKGKKLACPYFKQNQRREGRPVACIHPGFSNVARLKEHLYRIHKLPAICPRCQAQFDTEEEVTDHLNAPERCEKRPRKAHLEGFDREQELKLRTKKRSKGEGSEEEKWRGVYMILFPNASLGEVPSACRFYFSSFSQSL
ncbi:hypothetical protein BK809_0007863 [Diplodia seriata]|uniref:C2H2-type domain-containing protein n=1 Tax=Diplodia seriata TaxID=420778 RepID=A0A1S8BKK2_9PEZI|nr:hypothetical protein BK809_0007863 [Diplodia seriata]